MADFVSLANLLAAQQQPQQQSLGNLGNYGPRVLPQDYNTKLPQMDEFQFRQWLQQNNVPFDPNAKTTDYDMRGFYQAAQQQQPGISTAINPNDHLLHYTDRFKTPLHQSFSSESQWAGPNAPQWVNDSQLAAPNGRIVFDERKR
jgi:hypothetical protein